MIAEAFLDTNVLVYAVSSDAGHAEKARVALELIGNVDCGISTQVMSEFYVTATRKLARPLTHAQAILFLEKLRLLPTVTFDADLVFEALECKQRFQLSYWDAAIIAAAQRLDAATVFSEDLNNGQRFGKCRVVNPFSHLPKSRKSTGSG